VRRLRENYHYQNQLMESDDTRRIKVTDLAIKNSVIGERVHVVSPFTISFSSALRSARSFLYAITICLI
jgi:hypothetical protein